MKHTLESPSIFLGKEGLEYFLFEEDFMEANMRCIPMAVRFKLDIVRIKLKLSEWAKFSAEEKMYLAMEPCETAIEQAMYKNQLSSFIVYHTGQDASILAEQKVNNAWKIITQVPSIIQEKANSFAWQISIKQWQNLSNLQRFCLLKLTNPGHENKKFPIAMNEFGWL